MARVALRRHADDVAGAHGVGGVGDEAVSGGREMLLRGVFLVVGGWLMGRRGRGRGKGEGGGRGKGEKGTVLSARNGCISVSWFAL